ncbi:MAG: basic amino acid ABC transporter substrate-binding protein [Candidatus Thermoplasmatota archaeon]|nr:basic amino acid ABC transporter substrate-binding protein [Candidatus Thermoplasmatota archaeon]
MMNTKKKFASVLLIAAFAIAAVGLSGCVQEEDENVIIVGTSADFPPFEYMEGGEIIGFDIEMVTAVLESLNYTVEVQDIAFDGLIGSLQSGKIDIIAAAMSIDPERELEVDFTIPYFEADLSVLIMANSNIVLNDSNYLDELANLTIGAQTGTTGAMWVVNNLINITNATMQEEQFKRYETYTEAVLDLENGNLDAVVIDKPVGEAFAEDEDMEIAYTIVSGEQYGLAVKEGNTELLNKLNTALAAYMESDDWTALVKKYFE